MRCPLELPLQKRLRGMVEMGDLRAADSEELLDWVFQRTGTCEIRTAKDGEDPPAE